LSSGNGDERRLRDRGEDGLEAQMARVCREERRMSARSGTKGKWAQTAKDEYIKVQNNIILHFYIIYNKNTKPKQK
jgi:hypothetical protein